MSDTNDSTVEPHIMKFYKTDCITIVKSTMQCSAYTTYTYPIHLHTMVWHSIPYLLSTIQYIQYIHA